MAAAVAAAALVPLAALLVARRRAETVRRALALPAPELRLRVLRPAAAVAAVALLGLAAAQPVLGRTSTPRVRRDAQALFVLDVSRSMAASSTPHSPTRLARARGAAVRLRAAIPGVPSGVLTLTDRVLPDLLPVADEPGFDAVVQRAVAIESPPPRQTSVRATSYDALAGIASGNDFAAGVTRRLVVLLTDGESSPVDEAALAQSLSPARGYRFEAVRFWSAGESVFDAGGRPEADYRPDPSGGATLASLAAALGGRSFSEADVGAAASYLRTLAGTGPTVAAPGIERSRTPLAPWVALAAVLLLLAGLVRLPAAVRSRPR